MSDYSINQEGLANALEACENDVLYRLSDNGLFTIMASTAVSLSLRQAAHNEYDARSDRREGR